MVKKKQKNKMKIPQKWLILTILVFILSAIFFSGNSRFLSIEGIFSKPTPTPTSKPEIIDGLIQFPEGGEITKKDYIDLSIDTLSQKLNIPPGDIEVIGAEEKDWSDTSLGCPEKGKMYAQMITPGYLIELSYNGVLYRYHAGLERVVLCKGR